MESCKVDGCERLLNRHSALGLCATHYSRVRRGIPLDAPPRGSRPALPATDTHKVCGQCSENLPLEMFGRKPRGGYTYNCRPCQRWHSIRKRYGMDRADWNRLYQAQGGKCAICRDPFPNAPSKHVHTDHCHATMAVRGILCAACNAALGCVERAGLEAFERYLKG